MTEPTETEKKRIVQIIGELKYFFSHVAELRRLPKAERYEARDYIKGLEKELREFKEKYPNV